MISFKRHVAAPRRHRGAAGGAPGLLGAPRRPHPGARTGTNGVSTNGVTANLMFLTDFLGIPVNLLNLCGGFMSVDPICPQPNIHYYYCIITIH